MTAAETDFINEWTRTLLAQWCAHQIVHGTLPPLGPEEDVFLQHAKSKGWISAKGDKVLSPGFKTAASFLRR